MTRPVCVHCGTPYGRRVTTTETVRWDTPTKAVIFTSGQTGRLRDGQMAPPPPYRGNGIVTKETEPYLSADNGRMVMYRDVWDGESWRGGYDPFCTLRCALDYARKAYARSQAPSVRRVK